MLARIKFEDNTAFTSKDLEDSLAQLFGNAMEFSAEPLDKSPMGLIKYGINELIAHAVLDIYFNSGRYDVLPRLDKLRDDTLEEMRETINDVVNETISKLEEE